MTQVIPSESRSIVPPLDISSLVLNPIEVQLPGNGDPVETPVSDREVNMLRVESSLSRRDSQAILGTTDPTAPITYWSLDPSIATVDSQGYVTTLQAGSVDIIASQKHLRRRAIHTGSFGAGATLHRFVDFNDPNCLGIHLRDQVFSRLATEGEVATTRVVNGNPEYNPVCWAADLDFSGASYANLNSDPSATRHRNSLTMITPRHGMAVRHGGGGPNVGHILQFLDSENVIHERTVTHVRTWSNPLDMRMCQLDSDLPSTVKTYKLLPQNWRDYLSLMVGQELLLVFRTQFRRAQVRYWQRWSAGTMDPDGFFVPNADLDLSFFPLGENSPSIGNLETISHTPFGRNLGTSELGEPIYGAWLNPGNSGHPAFVVINDELVLMTCNVTGSNGNMFSSFIGEFSDQITAWGSSHQIQTVDISEFENYS